MSFMFVLKDKGTTNQGWWLKISNIAEYIEYKKNAKSPLVDGFNSALNSQEFGGPSRESWQLLHAVGITSVHLKPHVNNAGYLVGMHAQNNQISLAESAVQLEIDQDDQIVKLLNEGYNIYFNRNGGWHFGKNDYSDWYRSEKLVFPKFKKNQIKIEKFPMGKHYYAYIDNVQVHDGDTLKWNTYDEAYNYALSLADNSK